MQYSLLDEVKSLRQTAEERAAGLGLRQGE